MGSVGSFVAFCLASIALVVVPGPAVVYIVTRSIDQGRTAGLVSALGIATGGLAHVLAAAVGLSALLMLVGHGVRGRALGGSGVPGRSSASDDCLTRDDARPRRRGVDDAAAAAEPLGRIYGRGVVVNMLNPKTALFFFAFLPQFTTADGSARIGQIAVLGARVRVHRPGVGLHVRARRLTPGRDAPELATWAGVRRWWSGTIYIGLGLFTAVTGHRPDTA